MTLPIKYRKDRENIIQTFDHVDIASGTGYEQFYLVDTIDLKILTPLAIWAETGLTTGTSTTDAQAKAFDVDFDVTLNLPRTIKGIALFNLPFMISHDAVGDFDGFLRVRVRKVSGGVETEIATNDSNTLTATGATEISNMACVDVDVPSTIYKKGDTIRITVEGWASADGGVGTTTIRLGHDPMDNSALDQYFDTPIAIPATSTVQLPFKIDL